MFEMIIHYLLLVAVVVFVIVAVELKDLMKSAISLAVASALLGIIFYQLSSPYAAVFEISVVAGLITVLFMSTISLTSEKESGDRNEQQN
jgi:NADH-quinone oxidoreductase subunit J